MAAHARLNHAAPYLWEGAKPCGAVWGLHDKGARVAALGGGDEVLQHDAALYRRKRDVQCAGLVEQHLAAVRQLQGFMLALGTAQGPAEPLLTLQS